MARGKKTGGRRQGTPNKRTVARLEFQGSDGIDAVSPALAQMRKCAEKMLGLADQEQNKGEQANPRLIKTDKTAVVPRPSAPRWPRRPPTATG